MEVWATNEAVPKEMIIGLSASISESNWIARIVDQSNSIIDSDNFIFNFPFHLRQYSIYIKDLYTISTIAIGWSKIWVYEFNFSTTTAKRKRVFPLLDKDIMYMTRFVSETDFFALSYGDIIFNGTSASDLSSPKKNHAILFRH